MKITLSYLLIAALAALAAVGLAGQLLAQDLPPEAQQAIAWAKQDIETIQRRAQEDQKLRESRLAQQLAELIKQLRAQGRNDAAVQIERFVASQDAPPLTNAKCEVEWHGSWYQAVVLKREGIRFYIKYDGYGDHWNEWVGPERIRGLDIKEGKDPSPAIGSAVQILWGGRWWPGKLLKIENDRYYISYDNYGAESNEWVGLDRIRLTGKVDPPNPPVPPFPDAYPVGTKVDVEWHGTWFPSVVLKSEKSRWYIQYDGYGDHWNEWVGSERIRPRQAVGKATQFGVGDKVMIEWRGTWWPGAITQTRDNQYFIHYDNHDNTWDEWVGVDRLRPRLGTAQPQPAGFDDRGLRAYYPPEILPLIRYATPEGQ